MEAATGWTDGKPWEIARGELCVRESETEAWTSWTDRKPSEITGGELLGGRETEAWTLWTDAWGELRWEEAWTPWTDGKPWEIDGGELHWEGARRKRGHRGRMGNRGKYLGESSVGRKPHTEKQSCQPGFSGQTP